MSKKLLTEALIKFVSGISALGLLIFLPAGTFAFFNGWMLMAVLFIPMFFAGLVLMVKNPKLLAKRLDAKEKQKQQGIIIKISGVMFASGFIICGFNFRFSLYLLPIEASVAASVAFLAGYFLFALVLSENKYLSRTIEVHKDQKVIDSGLYAIVRHPMYSATLIMFLAMPIILGSVFAFPVFLLYPFIIARRIKYEEDLLERELDGYKKYKEKVKYRLIPFIW